MTTAFFAAEPTQQQRAELTALVEKWIDAEVQSDRNALSVILHKDFVSTFASGKTINKEQYLDFIIGLDISPFSVNNEAMIIHGDTAVVIDVTESGKTKFTYIAQKHDDKWLVIAQTFTSVKQVK
ncbi:MAG: nuclear transport factor 2 family protein [Gammaproteobacteria bacterium]|nr:nuclear transport factor 2 family protein [Gammaproteobacteria bacterium]NNJ72718.1 nuclear transport factor 2 family protein [Enterobacterales bacterium]